jgi:hypothetical protein
MFRIKLLTSVPGILHLVHPVVDIYTITLRNRVVLIMNSNFYSSQHLKKIISAQDRIEAPKAIGCGAKRAVRVLVLASALAASKYSGVIRMLYEIYLQGVPMARSPESSSLSTLTTCSAGVTNASKDAGNLARVANGETPW